MSANGIATVVKMLETLPEPVQDKVVDHLRQYIDDLSDEQEWEETFRRTRTQLVAAAKKARQEIADGRAQPMNLDDL